MAYKKFLLGSLLATIALVLAVMLVQWARQLFFGHTMTAVGNFSQKAILAGLLADGLRGIILSYAYPKIINYGTSYLHAIWYGMLASLLAATLGVIYQYGIDPALGIGFLFEEMFIILLQGILSGIAIGYVYCRK